MERPAELQERIAQRVEAMFIGELPAEVARLRKMGYENADCPGMQAIGYREFSSLKTAAWTP